MAAFCLDCSYDIEESKESSDGRKLCPMCGSLKWRYEEALSDNVSVGTLMHTKGFAGGLSRNKGLRFESKDGDSYSVSQGRFVKLNQHVDHEEKRYIKKVVDPVTGQILREVDEPLPDHKDRGSAKKYKP